MEGRTLKEVIRPRDTDRYVHNVIDLLTPALEMFATDAAFARAAVPEPLDLVGNVLEVFESLLEPRSGASQANRPEG
jgi:urocanate hydratase